ncbi:hypothetical protein [Sphingobacterium detergens]|uniref:DNA-directed RNA polymerase specialized sigma24 family protein n=1 Tax=Sphingobacterium detergens TaxID=1145106 RepID=A0A420AE06_SPHD1|nr:hypothetical protein [Sphingobacterium detergens]RKE42606.1 DNA-directed RNA polymerase specialized sigma24 family protein [Sphingobacterium detergens]
MKLLTRNEDVKNALQCLHNGNENGLKFFYQRFYDYFRFRAHRATDDECTGESIAQEAFLRLWLFRENVNSETELFEFLKSQVKSAINAFFQKSRNRFHRSLLRLDGIEDYQEFLLGYELEEEPEVDILYLEQLELEKKEQLKQLNLILPNLNNDQQLFIRLCLKYSFNYERIAYHMGGISDYEVCLRVEKTIEFLRSIFNNQEKMQLIAKPAEFRLNNEMTAEEAEIFRMRYELQYSFDQISEALQLDGGQVRKLFINAHAKIKTPKKTA